MQETVQFQAFHSLSYLTSEHLNGGDVGNSVSLQTLLMCELLITLPVPPAFHALTDVPESTGFVAPVLRPKPYSTFRPTQRHGRFETRLGACGGEEEGPDLRCKEG